MTQEELKRLLNYDQKTGAFTWASKPSAGVSIGDTAGTLRGGYIRIKISGKIYSAHRLAFLYMDGLLPQDHVDHINHVRNDNRWANLRHATSQENSRNATKRSDNTSGVTGVSWDKSKSKWAAQISVCKRNIKIGLFDYYLLACIARKAAEIKYNFHANHGAV